MQLPKYNVRSEKSYMVFEFISEGPKGRIPKLVKFSETNLKGLYNLAFGDIDQLTGEINDMTISNNGDSEKVLATVIDALNEFSDKHPEASIIAIGSTKARTRLYRMGITKYFDEIPTHYLIYGLRNGEWEGFEKETEYEAFLVKRKKIS